MHESNRNPQYLTRMPLTYNAVAELTKATTHSRGIQAAPGTTEPQPNVCDRVNRASRNRIVFSPQTIQQIQRKNRRDRRAKQPSNNNNPNAIKL